MNDICRLALDLIAFRVFEKPLSADVKFSRETLRKLFGFSRSHDVDNIVGSALLNVKAFDCIADENDKSGEAEENERAENVKNDEKAAFENSVFTSVYRCENFKAELNEIAAVFEKEKIENIPLKGSILRKYYPEEWLRTSCDIDILVKDNCLESAVNALIGGLSYKFKQRSEHDVSLFSPSGVHIELHYTLTGDEVNEKSSTVLNNVWNYVLPCSSYEKKLTNELFYFYHIAHMAKHFALGGCGVRPFIDLKIMNDKFVLNRKQLDEMLNEGGVKMFVEAAVKLSRLWFENGENKESFGEEIYVMSDYILYSGVYGSAENRVMVSQKKKGGKFGYAMSRIFLPYSVMKKMHPVLEKHKWLLPWFEVRRWFVILFDGRAKSAMQELKYNEIADLQAGKKYRDMMNKLEL